MKLSTRFLAPPLALGFLFLGLCAADAQEAQTSNEVYLRAPVKIELPKRLSQRGSARVLATTDFVETCEKFGPYQIQQDGQRVIINSYLYRPRNRQCGQQYIPGNRKTYTLQSLDRVKSYDVYFRGSDNKIVFVGHLDAAK